MGSWHIIKHPDFISAFNPENGKYFRSGIIKDGRDTGVDPFMAPFPELLDVGIMGHCIHGRVGLCSKAGVQCYQDGLHSVAKNMTVDDFDSLASQCSGKVFQFALGGCGDPDQHEHFIEILKICRRYRIVPSFTTSGLGITPEIARVCKEYCGAVAISWYRSDYTLKAVRTLMEAEVKTNIHYVLSRSSVDEALDRFGNDSFPDGINAVVILLHKPIGLGTKDEILPISDLRFKKLLNTVITGRFRYKIGFDSCTVPALLNRDYPIDTDSLDTCEGARWSAYITPDMKMLPCSFDNQACKWAVDLRRYSIKQGWESQQFEAFRKHFREACPDCENRRLCLGGCPICSEIVPCLNPNFKVRFA
ncbi:MAG: radical SAM protein [Lachnospiraceae bacterium]|nr:radical SAM protein [Lachnospiraceae bacterium]